MNMEPKKPQVRISPRGTRGRDLPGIGKFLYRLLSPLFGRILVRRATGLVEIVTIGARSGKRRISTVRAFPEGRDAWLVVASFGGSSANPAWFVNIASNPDHVWLRMKGREVKVQPLSLHGEERNKAWQRITTERSSFREYEAITDREIPVVRLTAEAPAE
jgi:deazaflavin-dependent oxidoreductase (nitroreductase family)